MEVIIKASTEHIESILNLRILLLKELGELASPKEEDILSAATRDYLQVALANGEFISYLAERDGKMAASSGIAIFRRPPYPGNIKGVEAYILNMYTLPEFRGLGIGKRLLQECLDECRARGVKRVWLHASQDGEPLYRKAGFTGNKGELELLL
ncbi:MULTISPECIES: GNAT family N-acetyltransferase [Bacillus]|uniref:Acetyltransferase n=1 Tax=Bacillus infantis NRRL B-14911 TaxID=1367477 RepID=U5L4P4_9BACI|nr:MULTISPECIES: GNAT family N-acetyltransferase [Bacillus]OXT17721.1 N-acetyltransferase [Bacillus sp. OG2]AGX02644.1 acetyltransferase [Bacillus infantis NRRL B-14911]EAR64376.1 acetyltransferase, putative [Bacillus sp. NRRL B-14911]MCA1035580.1 GNAT family N-acetyltransferase [Bacillus infantis]MDT0160802.1 GNAT family N-acetyltransferase [Bacillus sp. AG4(2022)]